MCKTVLFSSLSAAFCRVLLAHPIYYKVRGETIHRLGLIDALGKLHSSFTRRRCILNVSTTARYAANNLHGLYNNLMMHFKNKRPMDVLLNNYTYVIIFAKMFTNFLVFYSERLLHQVQNVRCRY